MTQKYTNGPEDAGDSWANETLPMRLRRELLDREIRKLVERKSHATADGSDASTPERPRDGERHNGG